MSLITLARASITVLWFALFIAIWISTWSRRRRDAFAAAAQMPLEDSMSTANSKEVRT